jgi:hypothetical protein
MKNFSALSCTAVALLSLATPASADLLQADFSGTAEVRMVILVGVSDTGLPSFALVNYTNVPFTATLMFDTDSGVLSEPSPGMHQLLGGYQGGSMTFQDIGTFFSRSRDLLAAKLTWADDPVIPVDLSSWFGHGSMNFHPATQSGLYQLAVCPGRNPCGNAYPVTGSLTILPSPGPVAGAGWTGLVAACAGMIALARRRRVA